MTYSITVSVYPNNEVRAIASRERGVSDYWETGGGEVRAVVSSEAAIATAAPLDITSKLSESPVPGFGGLPRPTRFGNNARRTISRCAGVFEADRIPPDEFLLLTGTIPGSTPEAFEAIARWSSWIVKTIKTWISDQGVESAYSIYVWEFQKRGALHIHYCIHCPDVIKKVGLLKGWKKRWTEVVDAVSKKSGIDVWERSSGGTWATNKEVIQADAQVIRKSVGAYLSKYLSKNAPTNIAKPWDTRRFHGPVRWWGVSRPLLKRCRELTETFKKECISHEAIRYLKEKVFDILNWSENRVFSYWDKACSTNVLLTYSPESCQTIYSYLWRDLCDHRTGPRNASTTVLETGNLPKDTNGSQRQGSGQSRDCHGRRPSRTTYQSLQPC